MLINTRYYLNLDKTVIKELLIVLVIIISISLTGCVERKLTITTQPEGAFVELNDEPIGQTPVTVSLNWYGDYNIRITKDGYETLKTHKQLKAPLHDHFPFDLFAQILYPGKITDSYVWNFTLEPKNQIDRETLLQNAQSLKDKL